MKYHIADIKIINGISLIIKFGMNIKVKVIAKLIPEFKFLKNSISSNRFKTNPRQTNTNNTLQIVFRNPIIR
jgi:hypothetical protein